MIPSGSKDPFALRRAANGIVSILVEHKLPLSARDSVLRDASRQYQGSEAEPLHALSPRTTSTSATSLPSSASASSSICAMPAALPTM